MRSGPGLPRMPLRPALSRAPAAPSQAARARGLGSPLISVLLSVIVKVLGVVNMPSPLRRAFLFTRWTAVCAAAMLAVISAAVPGPAHAAGAPAYAKAARHARAADPSGTPLMNDTFTEGTAPEF